MAINDTFSKIPHLLFYSSDPGESILEKTKIDDKYNFKTLFILDYLYMNTNRRGVSNFYLKDMITDCDYKYDTRKNKSYDQFHTILCKLQKSKIISCKMIDYDIYLPNMKPSDRITCTLDVNLDNQFSILYDKDKNKILNQTIDKTVDNKNLLVYFCYLNCKMYRRPKDDNIQVYGGRPEVCWPSFSVINKELGFTDKTIDKYNDLLVNLDLIRIANAGLWYYQDDPNKSLKESSNIYALYSDDDTTKLYLDEGVKYYKKLEVNSNRVFKGTDKYKNNNRILNGELGAIVKKEKHGKATIEDIARKNEILASTKPDEQKYKMMALLDAHPNEILSCVLGSDKYYDLENSLGLLDEHIEGKFADGITYNNYRWVMINYKESEHQKFVDWVNNKKTPKRKKGLIKKPVVAEDEADTQDILNVEFTPDEIQAIHEIDALNYDQIPEDVRLEMEKRVCEEEQYNDSNDNNLPESLKITAKLNDDNSNDDLLDILDDEEDKENIPQDFAESIKWLNDNHDIKTLKLFLDSFLIDYDLYKDYIDDITNHDMTIKEFFDDVYEFAGYDEYLEFKAKKESKNKQLSEIDISAIGVDDDWGSSEPKCKFNF